MFDTTSILNVAWLGGSVLLTITVALLYARGLHSEFPWFFRYLLLVLGRAPVLFFLRPYRITYFYSYWIAEAITVGLSLLVILEIYRHVLRSGSFNMTRSMFFTLNVALLALAAAVALVIETADVAALWRAILVLTQTARIVQIGLLALLLIASMFFNFYWRSLPFGFALGYGIYATVELVATTFRSSLGSAGNNIFALSKVLGYQAAVLVWIVFIYRHRPEHSLRTLPSESMAEWLSPLEGSAK